jgi:hypothetical protein
MTSTRSEPGRLSSDLSRLYQLPGQMSREQALAFSIYVLTQVQGMTQEAPSVVSDGPTSGSPGPTPCFSLRQAARYSKRSPAAISFAIRTGELKASRIGRYWKIRPENLYAWIDSYQE